MMIYLCDLRAGKVNNTNSTIISISYVHPLTIRTDAQPTWLVQEVWARLAITKISGACFVRGNDFLDLKKDKNLVYLVGRAKLARNEKISCAQNL